MKLQSLSLVQATERFALTRGTFPLEMLDKTAAFPGARVAFFVKRSEMLMLSAITRPSAQTLAYWGGMIALRSQL